MLTIKLNVGAENAALVVCGLTKMLTIPDENLEQSKEGQDLLEMVFCELGPEDLVSFVWEE